MEGVHTLTIWIGETIDRLRILPDDKPCTLRISEIVLLVPEPKE